MNSTNLLLNISTMHGMNFLHANSNNNQSMVFLDQNQTIEKVDEVVKMRNFTASKHSSRTKRSLSTVPPSRFEKLMKLVNINDHPAGTHNDPQDNSPKSLEGLGENEFYPGVLTDAKKTIDQILLKPELLHQSEGKKEREDSTKAQWEDLTKALKVIYDYQCSTHFDSKNMEIMKGTLEKVGNFFSRTPITTEMRFLCFKNWVGVSSFNLKNLIGFNDLSQAKIYLIKLKEILSSSNEEIQNIVYKYANALFKYQFIEKCLDDGCIVKQDLFAVIEKTFNLCKESKEKSEYYFIRNALMSFEDILHATKDTAFKDEIVDKLKQGFDSLFKGLTSKEERIVKQLSYLIIKSIREKNLVSLFPFCKKTTVKDIYPYQKEISIKPIKVNVTSAVDWNHDLMKQIHGKLQDTYSHFIKEFGSVLDINSQEIKCNLYVASSNSLYEIFNYVLLEKSTGNGGVTECSYVGPLCIPTAAIYVKNNELWNLEHEFNHILLHLHAGLKVNHPMDKFGKYGRLDWLNEGLSYVLIPKNFLAESVKRTLIEKGLVRIKDIIEATRQNYQISYSFVEYLLTKQKPTLNKILIYTKNEKEDLLKKELEKLNSLERDYHTYLMTRWTLPENTRKSTTVELQMLATVNIQSISLDPLLNQTTKYLEEKWTPEKGREAVRKITYGSVITFGLASACLAYMSKQKGGKGKGGCNRLKAIRDRKGNQFMEKPPEIRLRNNRRNEFFRNDSKSLQRKGNT
ncbi:MAG: collagenase [Candidatus Rhabdochlamydia oedothoracis]|nr:collagenase [Candidatus Rhabdochlamydia oedothoracis]